MQSYFHWNLPLPAAKKPKITEINDFDLTNQMTEEQRPEDAKDIYVSEEHVNINTYSHHWFVGEASCASNTNKYLKSKGKQVASNDN